MHTDDLCMSGSEDCVNVFGAQKLPPQTKGYTGLRCWESALVKWVAVTYLQTNPPWRQKSLFWNIPSSDTRQ